MYRIGVVGPQISVDLIIKHAKEIKTEMQFYPYSYAIMSETVGIIEAHDQEVDFWLFSGQLPHKIALQSKVNAEKMEYIYTFGEAVFQGILEKSYKLGHLPKGVSFDMVRFYKDYYEGIKSIKNVIPNMHILEYEVDANIDQLFQFHYDLYRSGEIEVAVTTYPSVQKRLEEANVPAYWMGPQKADIYHSIQILNEKVKTRYYKGAQATAIILQVNNYQQVKAKNRTGYKVNFLELDLQRLLLELCEEVDGYLLENGVGRYTIFSTRGVTEKKLPIIVDVLKRVERELECTLAVGLGSAATVYQAEGFAQQALQHSEESKTTNIVLMNDDGEIIEYLKNSNVLNYSSRSEDPEILKKLAETSVSIKLFSKLESLVSEMKDQMFITKDLAYELKMSDRNAQRIVAELLKMNLIEVCGEENRNNRGRPTKIYRMKA